MHEIYAIQACYNPSRDLSFISNMHMRLCMLCSCLFRLCVVVALGLITHNNITRLYTSEAGEWIDRQVGRQALKHMQSGDTGSTYLLQGHVHRPQNCPRLFKFFSASIMSLLIWSIPSSMRSSCSD